jgi:hypothetical protein
MFVVGIVLSVAVLALNIAVISMTFFALMSEQPPFGNIHFVAGGLSWLCLWLWIAMLFVRPRILRRHRA